MTIIRPATDHPSTWPHDRFMQAYSRALVQIENEVARAGGIDDRQTLLLTAIQETAQQRFGSKLLS